MVLLSTGLSLKIKRLSLCSRTKLLPEKVPNLKVTLGFTIINSIAATTLKAINDTGFEFFTNFVFKVKKVRHSTVMDNLNITYFTKR